MGHAVQVEHDPYRALERASGAPPQIYVLDIGLPGIDGHDYSRQRDRDRALAAGFDHHLAKPVDSTGLATILAGLPLA